MSSSYLTIEWAQKYGTSADDQVSAMVVGSDGSIYIAGLTDGNLGGQVYSGGTDSFLTKVNGDGTVAWTQLFGTSSWDDANALALGSDGAIYIGLYSFGDFDGQANLGPPDAFLVKINSDGTRAWTKPFRTAGNESISAIAAGVDGSVYVAGSTTGSMGGSANAGQEDAFLAKINPDGSTAWTQLLGSARGDVPFALTTRPDGAIYLAGCTYGNLDGQGNGGGWDSFVSKFDSDGSKFWTRLIGSSENEFLRAATTGPDGSVYFAGYVDQDDGSGRFDAFLSKVGSDGSERWTTIFGTPSIDWAFALSVDANGAVYVSGDTNGDLDAQANSGLSDSFVVKFDPDGQKVWAKLFGSTAADAARAIAVDTEGAVYVAGGTTGVFNGQSSAGGWDALLTKWLVDTEPPSVFLSTDKSLLKSGQTATITFALSETSADFTVGDVTVSGGTLGDFTGSGANFSAIFTPAANSTAAAYIGVASGAFSDMAGNRNADGLDANNALRIAVDTRMASSPVCFVKGTAIKTGVGSVPVQMLTSGTQLATPVGACSIRWVGSQRRTPKLARLRGWFPVRVATGALGDGLPLRDLYVSPDHALLVDGHLVHAKALINGTSIVQVTDWDGDLEYFHIETEGHEIVYAEGVPCETFIDNVSRRQFDNYAEFEELYPNATLMKELDLPRVKFRRQLPTQIARRLDERARELGYEVEATVGHA